MRRHAGLVLSVAALTLLILPAQAGNQGNSTRDMAQNNLRQIGLAYFNAASSSAEPANEKELLEYLEKQRGLLTSPHDGQPFVIVYRADVLRLQGQDKATTTLLAWERTGKNGGRAVLMADCKTVAFLTEAEFQRAAKAKGR